MTAFVKYRKGIDAVWRIRPDELTRFQKLRLDKNERIVPFAPDFWENFLSGIDEEMIQAYPEVFPLYEKLACFHKLEIENILLTAGSDAAIRHCFEVFVNPGDKVIYLEPTFAMVPIYGSLFGAAITGVRYSSDLKINTDDIISLIDEATSLIIIANPNSPTGTYIPNDAIGRIADVAAQFHVPLLIDEAYYGFCPHTVMDIAADHHNIIVTRTFSKVAGMAGLRVGYAMGHPDVISILTKFRPMYEVNSLGILFAMKILDNWHVVEKYGKETVEGRRFFSDFLKGCGFPVVDTETNFLHVNFNQWKDGILIAMNDKGILVRGMLNVQGYENYTRFSVGPREAMERVVKIIYDVFKGKHCS
jgi:histidinol-phosphate aminotransferase